MLSITKKIAIAASFMTLCSGQLYASDRPDETDTLAKPTKVVPPIDCTPAWWAEKFKNSVLKYKPASGNELSLKFSDLGNVYKGTFDLSACGNVAQYLVITTDLDRFFKIDGERNKTVILIAPYQSIEQVTKSEPRHIMSPIMSGWDAEKAPVGIFWRCSSHINISCFDHLTTSSISLISSENLFQNWKRSSCEQWFHDMYFKEMAQFSYLLDASK